MRKADLQNCVHLYYSASVIKIDGGSLYVVSTVFHLNQPDLEVAVWPASARQAAVKLDVCVTETRGSQRHAALDADELGYLRETGAGNHMQRPKGRFELRFPLQWEVLPRLDSGAMPIIWGHATAMQTQRPGLLRLELRKYRY